MAAASVLGIKYNFNFLCNLLQSRAKYNMLGYDIVCAMCCFSGDIVQCNVTVLVLY
jgi:hypothetical protein